MQLHKIHRTCNSLGSSSTVPEACVGSEKKHGSNALQMQCTPTSTDTSVMDSGSYEDSSLSWDDLYSIDWTPKELFLKFRQNIEGYQVGCNIEFDGTGEKKCNTKLVLKPLSCDQKWKIVCEPKHADLRLLTKKISIGPFLSLQVGIGHEFNSHTTGWKWKLTSAYGGNGVSQIRHKSLLPIFPGFDVRIGWNAEYVLPDIHGALGTGEPIIGMNFGRLYGSIERLEAIFTHAG